MLYERAHNWAIGSDPGFLRLRMAIRTTAALALSLGILFLLTKAAGQPVTVALLGVVITMIAARSVNEPEPRAQRITMALLPLPAAISIIAAALLAPHMIAADTAFVAVVFTAVYIRRFGTRGRALGMVAFMSYFFTLYLRAGLPQLPWMIGAVVVGTMCTFVMSSYVLPDRPEKILAATIRALRARMAIVVATTAEAVRTGRIDERRIRQIRGRTTRLNETALMVQNQIEDKTKPAILFPGLTAAQIVPWLFDAELSIEWVANAGRRAAAVGSQIPVDTRAELVGALTQLSRAIRTPGRGGLHTAADQARRVLDRLPRPTPDDEPGVAAIRRLALAIINAATATAEVRAIAAGTAAPAAEDAGLAAESDEDTADSGPGLRATTRQAIQVTVAATLAIVVGELVSPARWYWAVIAAFVIFAGTNSWAETLTRGWQRLLGTVLGVPAGMLVATLFAGDRTASVIAIFVCLFCAFYFMTVTYSLMTFWITTMLALMYGLLGQFSLEVLMLRIEETAIGAVIGIAVAILVLPTHTSAAVRDDTRAFLTSLSALIEVSIAAMFGGEEATSPTEQARELDRKLQEFRVDAKPLLAGVAGLASRRNIRRGLRLFTLCDRYGRRLAASSERYQDGEGSRQRADALTAAAAQTRSNIDALIAIVDGAHGTSVVAATDALDAAETLARHQDEERGPSPDTRRFLTAVHALRQIERAVVSAAANLGAHDSTSATATTSS